MAKNIALSDNQRTIVGFVVTAIIAVVAYMATLPDDQKPPSYIFGILGGVVIVAQLVKDQLGVRDATTARVAKEADSTLVQHREVPKPTSTTTT